MKDTALYEHLLGLKSPWSVKSADLSLAEQRVVVEVVLKRGHLITRLETFSIHPFVLETAEPAFGRCIMRALGFAQIYSSLINQFSGIQVFIPATDFRISATPPHPRQPNLTDARVQLGRNFSTVLIWMTELETMQAFSGIGFGIGSVGRIQFKNQRGNF